MTLAKRRIDVTITLGEGEFGEKIGDTITLTGHRVIAEIAALANGTQPQANLRIYGLPLSTINRLTTIGPTMTAIRGKNRISVFAGDDGAALSLIFQGTIDQAWGDFQAAPEVCLNLTALSALSAAMKPVAPTSFKGATAAEVVMKGLADQMGFAFENHGVAAQLSSPYLPGTAYDQAKSCSRAGDFNLVVDRGILAIWPKDGAIGGEIPVISSQSGMVGYPTFSSMGVGVTSIFRPDLRIGGRFELQSTIEPARGKWNIFAVNHSLESEKPGGPWFTYTSAYRGIE